MSGGHFNYEQFRLESMHEELQELVKNNDDNTLNDFGDKKGLFFSLKTVRRFEQAAVLVKLAQHFVHRVDWLVSGDDGEETFHERLKEIELSVEELENLDSLLDELLTDAEKET